MLKLKAEQNEKRGDQRYPGQVDRITKGPEAAIQGPEKFLHALAVAIGSPAPSVLAPMRRIKAGYSIEMPGINPRYGLAGACGQG